MSLLFDDLYNPGLAADAAEVFGPSTQRQALEKVRVRLTARETIVLEALGRYLTQHGDEPTSYELVAFMQAEHQARDVNDVRPRLTGLRAKGKVVAGDPRACRVTGNQANTWALRG